MSGTESDVTWASPLAGFAPRPSTTHPFCSAMDDTEIVPGTRPFQAARHHEPGLRTPRLNQLGQKGQKKWKEVTGQTRTSTLPTMSDREIGPQYRLSQDSVRLSPIMK